MFFTTTFRLLAVAVMLRRKKSASLDFSDGNTNVLSNATLFNDIEEDIVELSLVFVFNHICSDYTCCYQLEL